MRRRNNLYFTAQTDMNDKMRAILIDWLVEVHFKFKVIIAVLPFDISHPQQQHTAHARDPVPHGQPD